MDNQRPEFTELVTIRDFLRYAVSCFNAAQLAFGHGTDNAFDEAAYLVLHTLHLPIDRLEPFLDARLLDEEKYHLVQMIERRVNERLPAAYLTHEAWLGEHKFYIDERALIPRSYIAELLREGLLPWLNGTQVTRVLDLCTGSGCLAILTALTFSEAQVDASDVSEQALEVAQRNVTDYALEQRVRLVQSDMFSKLGKRKYDLILANPPYVRGDTMAALPQEYRHEPWDALASGDDGLQHTHVILREAKRFLAPKGLLVVEVGGNRAALEAAYPQLPFTWPEVSSAETPVFVLSREELA